MSAVARNEEQTFSKGLRVESIRVASMMKLIL